MVSGSDLGCWELVNASDPSAAAEASDPSAAAEASDPTAAAEASDPSAAAEASDPSAAAEASDPTAAAEASDPSAAAEASDPSAAAEASDPSAAAEASDPSAAAEASDPSAAAEASDPSAAAEASDPSAAAEASDPSAAAEASDPSAAPGLQLKFGGRLVEQLGAQMYPSATATVAELISNAWDADARHVWVEMPYGDWTDGEIVVTDDGIGMDLNDAQEAYLIVGRNRRAGGKQRTDRKRLVHGRKGIGKLAAFGTATVLEVKTRKADAPEVAFRLDYDMIRTHDPDTPYQVEPSQDAAPLADPLTGQAPSHGTRIKLTGLRLKRKLNPDQFATSMSRRFALNEHEMTVFINGEKLRRFDTDLQFRFPRDRIPPEAALDGDWAMERLPDGKTVRWWIGFTPKPIKDDAQQGISVIVRGKLAQRPFKFDAGGGTTGQLGQEYLVGEVAADWIDDEDSDSATDRDYIQSNRDQLQLEDEDLAAFLNWGRRRLRWALNARDELKRAQQQRELQQNKALERLLSGRPKRERSALVRVASAVARLPEAGEQEVVRVMEAVIGARDEETTRALAHEISLAAGDPEEFWALVRELAEMDGRSALVFIEARLATLAQLKEFEPGAALSNAVALLSTSPGLLNPRWELLDVVDAGERETGVHTLLLQGAQDGHAEAVVLLVDTSAPTDAPNQAFERVRRDHPGLDVILLTTNPAKTGRGISWSDLLRAAEQQHNEWHALVTARVARSSTNRA